MNNTSIIVYIDRVKKDKNNLAPIYCRIKVEPTSTTKVFSFGVKVEISRWESTNGLTNTKSKLTEDEKKLRQRIDDKVSKMSKWAERQDEDEQVYTAEMVYNAIENPNPHKDKTMLQAIELHKKEFFRLVDINERKESGYKKYQTVHNHLEGYMKAAYNQTDYLLCRLNNDFQMGFQAYLVGKVGQNAVSKYVQHLRTIVDYAKSKNWIQGKPLEHYSIKKVKVKKQFLTFQEVLAISEKKMPIKRLEVTKDIFLFNILTGYAWTDVSKLTYNDIKHIGNAYQIVTERNKTEIEANVVLTSEAMILIDKYRNDPECMESGKLFPFNTNQKMNAYLKEVATLCKIDKNLSTKIARNTYATLCLNRGMNLKALSTSMGHTNTRQTEEYATLLNETLVMEMKKMEGVLKVA